MDSLLLIETVLNLKDRNSCYGSIFKRVLTVTLTGEYV